MTTLSANCLEKAFYPTDLWQQVTVTYKNKKDTFDDVVDTRTQRLYNHDRWYKISLKATGLFFALPIFQYIGILIHAVRTLVHPIVILVDEILEARAEENKKEFSFAEYGRKVFIAEKQNLWRAIRSPFYSTFLQLTALATIFFPREGAKRYANIEKAWCENIPKHRDIFKDVLANSKGSADFAKHLFRAVVDYKNEYTIYSGYCFQHENTLDSPNITNAVRS